jgi:two-component system CheB/CheR fusion protein
MLFAGRRIEPNLITKYGIDIGDRKRAEQERELLANELTHRVKNTLAVVQALAVQTEASSVEAFREALVRRLGALAAAHDLLLGSNWQSANLQVLITNLMSAYRSERGNRIDIDGPAVTVTARQALGLSLVLHELAANAAKYGSLSNAKGRVELSWHNENAPDGHRMLHLHWRERGGAKVVPPTRRGFGVQLIERVSEYELEGDVKLTFDPKGLICEIAFPLTQGV